MIGSIGHIDDINGVICKCIFEDNLCCSKKLDCLQKYCKELTSKINEKCVFIEIVNRCYVQQPLLINLSLSIVDFEELTDIFSRNIVEFKNRVLSLCKITCASETICKCEELFLNDLFINEDQNELFIVKPQKLSLCTICNDDKICECKQMFFTKDGNLTFYIDDNSSQNLIFKVSKPTKIMDVCKILCGSRGGVQTKNGKICKCVEIDESCCRSESDCYDKYCSIGERAEDPDKEKCKFTKQINICYSYKFLQIMWK
jgi:hypothetical protein